MRRPFLWDGRVIDDSRCFWRGRLLEFEEDLIVWKARRKSMNRRTVELEILHTLAVELRD